MRQPDPPRGGTAKEGDRQGDLDPWSGQRPAFPLNADPGSTKVRDYLASVRQEARELALHHVHEAPRKRPRHAVETPLDYGEPNSGDAPAPAPGGGVERSPSKAFDNWGLSPEDLHEIKRYTKQLLDPEDAAEKNRAIRDSTDLLALFTEAHRLYCLQDSVHPGECTSLATWKAYASHHDPQPLDHTDVFRVFKYLIRWNFSSERHYYWSWALLLRTPLVLTGDEISVLRDVSRQLATRPSIWSRAFTAVVAEAYGQKDLSL